ncbi:ionotropic receptor 25a-like [Mizuhopecten yessoensis]|uniref:ionotropic receptor 25a-like n=1 Tax=Mizuhopecten yessoensis TaxID=6573 RepID=UPI000B458DA1|nr:ionotropic receptor 25a-like [Mizuhopecten yessoensis]
MLPTWIPCVCVLSILLWMTCTGISSLRIDTYVFDDWGNETNYIRMLMEKEIASWTRTVNIPVSLHFTAKSLTIDYNLFAENDRIDDVNDWNIVLDLTTTIDLMNCGAAMANNVPYITSSSEASSDCHPITFRTSPSNILQPVVDMFEIGGTTSEVKLLLLDSGYELDPSIFDTRNNSESEVMVYSINELVLEERAARRLLINARRVIILAPYLQILHFFNQMEQTVKMLKNEWILLPVDSETCPGHLNISYICIEGYYTANTTRLWMDALNFIKGAVKTLEQVDANTNDTGMEYFNWYSSSNRSHQPTISISKHTSFNSSRVVGEFAAGRTTLYERPEDLFEPPPPPVLKVVVIHEPPFVQRVIQDNGSVSYEGYSIDVLHELARRSGFKYEIYEVPDNEYGVLRSNGTWSGVIGQVATGAADMGAGPISVTAEREAVIDFTAPYYDYAGLQILTKDTREPPSLFVFVTVFTELAWGVWLSLLIATVVILCVFHRLKYKYLTEEDTGCDSKEKFTIKNSFWFVIMSVAIAGPEQHPSMTSTRLVVAGFWFFCQIIMSAYTANLAAFLTSSRLASPVESLDDLVTQSAYQYTVQKGTVGETYFQRMAKIEAGFYSYWKDVSFSTDSSSALTQYAVWDYPLGDKYIKLWQSMQETGYVLNTEEGIAKVLEGNFVLFHETPIIKFEMSRRCGLLSVGTMFSAKPYAFVLPQNSPNVKDISSAILSIQSTTILTKLKEKWWESNNITCPNNDDSDGLTLNAVGGMFIVIGGGCLLSVLILGVELLIAKCGKSSVPFLAGKDKVEERDVHRISHQTNKSGDISDVMLSKLRSSEVQDSVNTSNL